MIITASLAVIFYARAIFCHDELKMEFSLLTLDAIKLSQYVAYLKY
jgi:hypothetical protein